tara:strand:- start:430 stop:1143 length:714 start_codon:yes stop_codon:yes gene_type:complete
MQQVLITGASSDIGIATCRKYLSNGFHVVGHYNRGQDRFFELVDSSQNIQAIQIDMSNPDNIEKAFVQNEDLFRETDVLINMAAINQPKPFPDITAGEILEALNVNLVAALLFIRMAALGMIKRKWGRIVNIGSIGVKFGGGSKSFCYALSKHSLEFFPADHKKWAADNVLINTLRVGVTDTKIHHKDPEKNMELRVKKIPAQRMASPDEIADMIYWHGSGQNTFVTGQIISVSGGE